VSGVAAHRVGRTTRWGQTEIQGSRVSGMDDGAEAKCLSQYHLYATGRVPSFRLSCRCCVGRRRMLHTFFSSTSSAFFFVCLPDKFVVLTGRSQSTITRASILFLQALVDRLLPLMYR
jgi:hypothetical protein